MEEVHANVIQRIPPRSPDLNPIENVFNVVKKQLKDEALEKNIENETKDEYEKRVLAAFCDWSNNRIDGKKVEIGCERSGKPHEILTFIYFLTLY